MIFTTESCCFELAFSLGTLKLIQMPSRKPPEPLVIPPPIRDAKKLGDVLSQVIAMRGIGRIRGDRQLADAWKSVAGPEVAAGSRPTILARLKAEHPALKVRDLKFKLQSRE